MFIFKMNVIRKRDVLWIFFFLKITKDIFTEHYQTIDRCTIKAV